MKEVKPKLNPFLFLLFIGLIFSLFNGYGQEAKVEFEIEKFDSRLDALIDAEARIEVLAEGFDWIEGPLWVESHQMLLFSNIPSNSIYKWTQRRGAELYLQPSGYTGDLPRGGETGSNGLLLHPDGHLVLCQHGDRRMAKMAAPLDAPKAEFVTLADEYMGKKFNSPNDAVFKSNGDLYFTDPPYGLEKNVNDPLKESPYQGVYKVSGTGEVTLLLDSLTRPNGIALLPNEKTIIIANSDPGKPYWYAYDLDTEGIPVSGRIFYDATAASKTAPGMPDGLKVDRKGNVFATGPGGVWIFSRQGKALGRIKINQLASNCALANQDKTLFITADNYLLKLDLK